MHTVKTKEFMEHLLGCYNFRYCEAPYINMHAGYMQKLIKTNLQKQAKYTARGEKSPEVNSWMQSNWPIPCDKTLSFVDVGQSISCK